MSESDRQELERWFGEPTGRLMRLGAFARVDDLIVAIEEYLAAWNPNRSSGRQQ
jgi:hypothetical protein